MKNLTDAKGLKHFLINNASNQVIPQSKPLIINRSLKAFQIIYFNASSQLAGN